MSPFYIWVPKITIIYYPTTHAYHEWRSYDVWFLRYKAWQSFLSLWATFCPLTPLTTWKVKVLKKIKKGLKILSFYICILQMMIIWCMVPEIWSAADMIFFVILDYFCPFTPLTTQKIKTLKKLKKLPVDTIILHMCIIHKNHMIYGSWDMVCNRFFLILDHFLHFYNPENQNFEKMKKMPGDIIISHKRQ